MTWDLNLGLTSKKSNRLPKKIRRLYLQSKSQKLYQYAVENLIAEEDQQYGILKFTAKVREICFNVDPPRSDSIRTPENIEIKN